MGVQQVHRSKVAQSKPREDQYQTHGDHPDNQGACDRSTQRVPTHKIQSNQEQDSCPDFGRHRCHPGQSKREPEIQGDQRQNTVQHDHGGEQRGTASSQIVLHQPTQVAALIADRPVARHRFSHRSNREHIDQAYHHQDDHAWQWSQASQGNGQSENGCANDLGESQRVGCPERW